MCTVKIDVTHLNVFKLANGFNKHVCNLQIFKMDDYNWAQLDDYLHASVRSIKVGTRPRTVFKTMVTGADRDLLHRTVVNLGFGTGGTGGTGGAPDGLLLLGLNLSDDNEMCLFRSMGFDFTVKYLVLRDLIVRYKIDLATWESFLPMFCSRKGVNVEETPERKHKFTGTQGMFTMTTTKQLAGMVHATMKGYNLVRGPTRGEGLDAMGYPGHELVRSVRMKTLARIPETHRVDYVKAQVWSDSPYAIFEVMEDMICQLEPKLAEPPRKKIKVEAVRSYAAPEEGTVIVPIPDQPRSYAAPEDATSAPEGTVIVPIPEVRQRRNAEPNIRIEGGFVGKRVVAQYKNSWEHREEPPQPRTRRTWRNAMFFIIAAGLLRVGMEANFTTISSADVLVDILMTVLTGFCVFRLSLSMGSSFEWVVCGILEVVLYFWDEVGIAIPHGVFLIFAVCMQLPQRFIWQSMFVAYVGFISFNFWFQVLPVWAPFVQIPMTCLSLWNQHRQGVKNPASLLIAPYRDTICIIFLILSVVTCLETCD